MTMRQDLQRTNGVFGPLVSVAELDPEVARFHLGLECVRGKGPFRIERGSRFSSFVATALRLPRAGAAVQVSLLIQRQTNSEKWFRTFDGLPCVTMHSLRRGQLVETVGPLALELMVTSESSRLIIELRRVALWIRGLYLPLPGRATLRIEACVSSSPTVGSVHVRVHIWSTITGLLVRYEGDLDVAEQP